MTQTPPKLSQFFYHEYHAIKASREHKSPRCFFGGEYYCYGPFRIIYSSISWQPPSHFFKNAQTAFWLFAPLFSFDCFRLYSLLDFRKYSRKWSNFFCLTCGKCQFLSTAYTFSTKLSKKIFLRQRQHHWQPYIARYP